MIVWLGFLSYDLLKTGPRENFGSILDFPGISN